MKFIKESRERFLDRHSDADDWRSRYFSATTFSLWRAARAYMAGHCRGLVLDAGAGRGSWRGAILRTATTYESVDISERGAHRPTWVADLSDMAVVPTGHYDTVVCHQVLEHVRRPWLAVSEIARVLAPGGTLIVSVPHLNRRHELPHDYFRYTQEGLVALLEDCGFELVQVRGYGGVLGFLHHQASFAFPGLVAGIPVIGWVASLVNAPVSWLVTQLDGLLDRGALMPLGVIAVARKPADVPVQGVDQECMGTAAVPVGAG